MRALCVMMAATLAATPAMAADQFDLVCRAKATEVRYRVDLARGEWCGGKCLATNKIASVTSGEIVLDEHKPQFRNDDESVIRINRQSGEWFSSSFSPSYQLVPIRTQGMCEAAPFTGFPLAKF